MSNPGLCRILTAGLLLITFGVKAQQFGGNPPSIKWDQVNTPAARVIYPRGMDSAGRRVANVIGQINNAIKPTIGFRQKQVNVLLQNQLVTTNGYVGLAPFRSEFYLVPAQNSFSLGSLNVTDQLAIHEFRHVQQYNSTDVGLTRLLHILFGEGGQQLASGLSLPNWFFEGDAVFNETYVTDQGRGRLPYFFNGFRSLWAAGKNYSWMKIRNGSYRDYTPDWYPLGYMLISYGRDQYGSDIWRKVGHDAASYRSLIYPFQSAVKRNTGQNFTSFRNASFEKFKKQLVDDDLKQGAKQFNKDQHFIGNQEFPVYVNDTTLIYRTSSYKKRSAFVMRTRGKEQRIRLADFSIDSYFTYRNGQIVYASRRPDARWSYREFNELKVIDVKTGAQKKISNRTRYFAPAFNADNSRIVAVDVPTDGQYALHILNADGKLISKVANPEHLYYTYPKFYNEQQIVSAVRKPSGEMLLALIDIATGKMDPLTPPTIAPKAFPVVQKDTVYFTATSGIDDKLFAVSMSDHKLYGLEGDSLRNFIGNYQPAVSENKVSWVSFSAFGYRLHEASKAKLQRREVKEALTLPDMQVASLQTGEGVNALNKVTDQPLPTGRYPKFTHPFNFHSLIPYIEDPDYSVSLMGENILNTLRSELSFGYNRNEGYKQIGATMIYGATFPYLFGGVQYTIDRRDLRLDQNRNPVEVNWNETRLQAGVQLPLSFINGRNVSRLNLSSSINYSITDVKQATFRSLYPDNTYLSNSVTFSNQVSKPQQLIYPHFAQNITLSFRNTINDLSAKQFLASGSFYFPGLFDTHSLVISAAHQRRDRNYSIFSNQLSFSRGYTADNLYRLYKFGLNYHFPVAYPDAGFGDLVYLLRLRGNVFYDHTHGIDQYRSGAQFKANFRSAGAELYFDTQWFNETSITFGLRYTRLLDRDIFGGSGPDRFTLILPLSIF